MNDDNAPSESIVQRITPDLIRRSFVLKFGIGLLVIGLAVGVIGVVATNEVRSETQQNVESEFQNTALQKSNVVEQWVSQNKLSAWLISNQDRWANDDRNLEQALENERARLPDDAKNIHLLERGPDGTKVVASTSIESGTDANLAYLTWVSGVSVDETSKVTVSNVYADRDDETPTIGFVTPAPAADDRLLVFEYGTYRLAESLRGVDGGDDRFSQVVSNDGTIIADLSEGGEGSGGTDALSQYPEVQTVLDGNNLRENAEKRAGVRTSMPATEKLIDEEYTVGYAPVDGTDWVVLTHAPTSNVFGLANQIQKWGLLTITGQVVLIGSLGLLLAYSTGSAIDRLTRKTEEMREGNLDIELQTTRIDNIGRLYVGFGDMRDALKNQIDEAERARKEAEVSRAEAMEMSNYLQEKATEFSIAMEETAGGDMTTRMEQDGENEAMDTIAAEFNQMIEELEKTTGQLKSFSEEVAESGDVVLTSAESVKDASEQVAAFIQRISDQTYEQKDQLQHISEDLDELVETLEGFEQEHPELDLTASLEQFRAVATQLQEAADTSEEMMQESETVAGAAEEQAAELNEVSSRAKQLKRYARPLGDILERFETDAEHEFVFSGGPSQTTRTPKDEE
ncbi:HAMP domain-containing protein [Halobacteriales archaeon QS_4_62_28]|nr:MAG: HAMP domain-containing protein [Halobacteriales archaeon QS_4_62_28]